MIAGIKSVKIPFNILVIAGATASNMPTSIPKNETNANTVPAVKNPDTSLTGTKEAYILTIINPIGSLKPDVVGNGVWMAENKISYFLRPTN